MKRLSMAIMLALWALGVWAQNGKIEVKFLGSYPDIIDFAWAYATHTEGNEDTELDESTAALQQVLERYRTGREQQEDFTITVDKKAGYILVESKHDGFISKWEMCYWNMADKKHKLFAVCIEMSENGKRMNPGQFDCLNFYRYDNATRKMTAYDAGVEVDYFNISYGLPRTGKDITVTHWSENGREKWQTTLKWNGNGFGK
jgi:hypothetical protein